MKIIETTEENFEELMDILDYDTPLYGQLLQTGDEIPSEIYISFSIGILALLILVLLRKKI